MLLNAHPNHHLFKSKCIDYIKLRCKLHDARKRREKATASKQKEKILHKMKVKNVRKKAEEKRIDPEIIFFFKFVHAPNESGSASLYSLLRIPCRLLFIPFTAFCVTLRWALLLHVSCVVCGGGDL